MLKCVVQRKFAEQQIVITADSPVIAALEPSHTTPRTSPHQSGEQGVLSGICKEADGVDGLSHDRNDRYPIDDS
jgi:hypothetical protein